MRTTLNFEFRVLFLAILAVVVPFGLLLYVFLFHLVIGTTGLYWASRTTARHVLHAISGGAALYLGVSRLRR